MIGEVEATEAALVEMAAAEERLAAARDAEFDRERTERAASREVGGCGIELDGGACNTVPTESPAMTPRERAEAFALRFRGQANHLALQFGGPVYLVGSMLTSLTPGDVDIRLAISQEDLDALFGEGADAGGIDWSPAQFMRCREELKQSRRLTRRWRRAGAPRFDFKFQKALFGINGLPIDDDRPRVRLDAVPLEMFAAGRGDP